MREYKIVIKIRTKEPLPVKALNKTCRELEEEFYIVNLKVKQEIKADWTQQFKIMRAGSPYIVDGINKREVLKKIKYVFEDDVVTEITDEVEDEVDSLKEDVVKGGKRKDGI